MTAAVITTATASTDAPQWLAPYYEHILVVDLCDGSVLYGTIASATHDALSFCNADLHDIRESNSSKEVYGLETQTIGVRVNRKQCTVPLDKIIAICLITDLQ